MTQKYVIKTHLRLLAYMACFVLVFTAGSLIAQTVNHSQNKSLAERNATEVQFWKIIGGDVTPTQTGVDVILANDLRDVVDEGRIGSFRGNSNLYGGISRALGYDPFDGANCDECGPLRADVQSRLALIAAGEQQAVYASVTKTYDTSGYTLTLFGLSILVSAIMIYLIIVPIVYVCAHVVHDEDIKPSAYTLGAFPAAWVFLKARDRYTNKKSEKSIREQFPEYAKFLDRVDKQLDTMGDAPERTELLDNRNSVHKALLNQVRESTYSRTDGELQLLMSDLSDLSSVLEARAEARRDLESM